MSGVRQEEDHGGDGGEERVVGGQKKKEKQEGQVRTTETTVKIGMRARRSLKSRSPGCEQGSRCLGITFSSRLGGPVGSVRGKPASMTKPSSCTYVLSSSCLCCKYMIVPNVCSFNSLPHPVTKRPIIDFMKSWNLLLKHPSTLTTKAAFRSFLTLGLGQGLIMKFLASSVH